MQRIALAFLIFQAASFSASADSNRASQNVGQSFESCSLITSEYVTVLQLSARGLPPEALKDALPDITPQARRRVDALTELVRQQGLTEGYSTVFSEYAACAKRVVTQSGKPAPGTREAHFYRCSGEAKLGYEVSVAAMVGGTEAEVLPQVPEPLKSHARSVFKTFRADGAVAVFDQLSNRLKRCLNKMP